MDNYFCLVFSSPSDFKVFQSSFGLAYFLTVSPPNTVFSSVW